MSVLRVRVAACTRDAPSVPPPPDTGVPAATELAAAPAYAGRYGRSAAEMASALEAANEIKARRALQATVLHAMPHVFQAGIAAAARGVPVIGVLPPGAFPTIGAP